MTADGPADTSARAEFSGVMVIDTVATATGKPKTLYVTGAFYTGMGAVMGAFKYFNKFDHCIEPGSRWFVHTTVRSCFFFPFSFLRLNRNSGRLI